MKCRTHLSQMPPAPSQLAVEAGVEQHIHVGECNEWCAGLRATKEKMPEQGVQCGRHGQDSIIENIVMSDLQSSQVSKHVDWVQSHCPIF